MTGLAVRKLLTIGVGAVLVVLLLAIGIGGANAYEFNQRALRLQADWQQERAAGVSSSELAPLRGELAGLRQSHRGPLPYPYQTQLRKAKQPSDYQRLTKSWNAQLAQVTASRQELSNQSGGLTNGLPTDVVNGLAQLSQQAGQLQQANLWTDPATPATQAAKTYLAQSYATMAQQHQAIAQQLGSANQTLAARLQLHTKATTLAGTIPALVQQYGSGTNDGAQLQQAQQELAGATADAQLSNAVGELQTLYDALYQKKLAAQQAAAQQAHTVSAGGCIQGAPAKLIVVHVATQQLVAYQNGCPTITTPVTTGRPGLRTDEGTFHIFAKHSQFQMVSMWPPGSPYWYPTTWVPDAMEIVNDGTFLHGAPWEPDSAMGPGSEDGPYASHGCVHIPSTVLPQLYAWADVGTTVTVES
jgi:lipoprotein-anchoring transpeptidase ErfK/SrfK